MSNEMIEISGDDDSASSVENFGDVTPLYHESATSPRTSTGTSDFQPVKKKLKHDKERSRLSDYNRAYTLSLAESSGVSGKRVSKAPERPGYQDSSKIDAAVLNQRLPASSSKSKGVSSASKSKDSTGAPREKAKFHTKYGMVDSIEEANRLARMQRMGMLPAAGGEPSRGQTVPAVEAMKIRNMAVPSGKVRDCDKVAPEDGPGVASKVPRKPAKKVPVKPVSAEVAQASPKSFSESSRSVKPTTELVLPTGQICLYTEMFTDPGLMQKRRRAWLWEGIEFDHTGLGKISLTKDLAAGKTLLFPVHGELISEEKFQGLPEGEKPCCVVDEGVVNKDTGECGVMYQIPFSDFTIKEVHPRLVGTAADGTVHELNLFDVNLMEYIGNLASLAPDGCEANCRFRVLSADERTDLVARYGTAKAQMKYHDWTWDCVLEVKGPVPKGESLNLSNDIPYSLAELKKYEEAPEEIKNLSEVSLVSKILEQTDELIRLRELLRVMEENAKVASDVAAEAQVESPTAVLADEAEVVVAIQARDSPHAVPVPSDFEDIIHCPEYAEYVENRVE